VDKAWGNGEVAVNFTLDGMIDTGYPLYGVVPIESRSSKVTAPWGNGRFFLPQAVDLYFNGEFSLTIVWKGNLPAPNC